MQELGLYASVCLLNSLTHPFELNPEGRSWHSLTFITDTRAIVYGGLNQYNIVLSKYKCMFGLFSRKEEYK